MVAPPFTALKMISEVSKDSYIAVSAQNIHQEENGAYTGEIAASFVKDAGRNLCHYWSFREASIFW